jgi:maltooligosyltrehalose trehalohydrolase
MPKGGVHFRVWAPRHTEAVVVLKGKSGKSRRETIKELAPEAAGYFSGMVSEAEEGCLYRFRFDAEKNLYPDPASRFQPEGPEGPSQVIDPSHFSWTGFTGPSSGPRRWFFGFLVTTSGIA